MIPIDIFDDYGSDLYYKITKYVNENLKVMIRVFIDMLNDDNGWDPTEMLEEVLPRDYVRMKQVECTKYGYHVIAIKPIRTNSEVIYYFKISKFYY